MNRRAAYVAALAVAIAIIAAGSTLGAQAAPGACRYATPSSLFEVVREAPVVVLGRVQDAGMVAGGPTYDLVVTRVLSGGAPADIEVTYDGDGCADVQPSLAAGRDHLLFLTPSFTTAAGEGTPAFRGSPHGAFLVHGDALEFAGGVASPFTEAAVAGTLRDFEAELRKYDTAAAPWAALSAPGTNLGHTMDGGPVKDTGADLAAVVGAYRRVFIAQVRSLTATSLWSEPGAVQSEARLQVVRRLRWNGGHADPFISLRVPGGIIAGSTWEDPSRPLMRPGEYYLVFAGCRKACPGSPVFQIRNGFVWAQSEAWVAVPAARALHGLPVAAAVAAINRAAAEAAVNR